MCSKCTLRGTWWNRSPRVVTRHESRLWYSPTVHPKWHTAPQTHGSSDNTTENSRGLRSQEILVASSDDETARYEDAETFRATSPYSFVQYVIWRHLSGTTLRMCFTTQTSLHAVHTYRLENIPLIALFHTTQYKNVCLLLCAYVCMFIQF
jgi:hypothetical protein